MAASRHSTEQESDFSTGLCIFYIGREGHHHPRLTSYQFINRNGKKNSSSGVLAKASELILIDPARWVILEPVIVSLIYQQ